ncbi:MAG: hypothetical protein ACM3S1_01485, partial [Hyphomicrobiales bacterium]
MRLTTDQCPPPSAQDGASHVAAFAPPARANVGRRRPRLLVPLLAALLALAIPALARADGETGIVIQNGDNVTTYCVAFQGDSIDGYSALQAAGLDVDLVQGGALCAIDGFGCPDAGNQKDCFCECRDLSKCTYWAYFTKDAGTSSWIYSNAPVTATNLHDGDMEALKWGPGSGGSAPAPVNVDFATVCPARFQPTATPT